MATAAKKSTRTQVKKTTKKTAKPTVEEFRPYRVLFLVVVIAVTCLVLFIGLGAANDR